MHGLHVKFDKLLEKKIGSATFASSEYCSGQFFPNLESPEQMWFLTGTSINAKDNRRYIPVHELSRSFSPTACQILHVAHALTGCNTTSSLFRMTTACIL
jgi:hypothetical protein